MRGITRPWNCWTSMEFSVSAFQSTPSLGQLNTKIVYVSCIQVVYQRLIKWVFVEVLGSLLLSGAHTPDRSRKKKKRYVDSFC